MADTQAMTRSKAAFIPASLRLLLQGKTGVASTGFPVSAGGRGLPAGSLERQAATTMDTGLPSAVHGGQASMVPGAAADLPPAPRTGRERGTGGDGRVSPSAPLHHLPTAAESRTLPGTRQGGTFRRGLRFVHTGMNVLRHSGISGPDQEALTGARGQRPRGGAARFPILHDFTATAAALSFPASVQEKAGNRAAPGLSQPLPLAWTGQGEVAAAQTSGTQQAATQVTVHQSIQQSVAIAPPPPTGWPAGTGATPATPTAQPRIDLNRLTDEVCRRLEQKLQTERERRGK